MGEYMLREAWHHKVCIEVASKGQSWQFFLGGCLAGENPVTDIANRDTHARRLLPWTKNYVISPKIHNRYIQTGFWQDTRGSREDLGWIQLAEICKLQIEANTSLTLCDIISVSHCKQLEKWTCNDLVRYCLLLYRFALLTVFWGSLLHKLNQKPWDYVKSYSWSVYPSGWRQEWSIS